MTHGSHMLAAVVFELWFQWESFLNDHFLGGQRDDGGEVSPAERSASGPPLGAILGLRGQLSGWGEGCCHANFATGPCRLRREARTQRVELQECPGFGWDRVNSLLSSWYSAVFWI